jgi:hypothetical protein
MESQLQKLATGMEVETNMFCIDCGSRLVGGDCNNCFKNKNALKEFEGESDE